MKERMERQHGAFVTQGEQKEGEVSGISLPSLPPVNHSSLLKCKDKIR